MKLVVVSMTVLMALDDFVQTIADEYLLENLLKTENLHSLKDTLMEINQKKEVGNVHIVKKFFVLVERNKSMLKNFTLKW